MSQEAKIARVIDFETSGFDQLERSEVVEVGRVDLMLDDLTISNPWRAYAAAKNGIPPEAKAVHHITEADTVGADWFGELVEPFMDGCAQTDVLAAHNAKFEKWFYNGDGRSWICTYKCALVVWLSTAA